MLDKILNAIGAKPKNGERDMSDCNKRNTQIFISYASEDALIANAFEAAFSSLASDGNYALEVVRDIHSFQQGRSLTGQIHESLETSDILFIIYTEQLKQSHSFTGMELGSFGRLIFEDKKRAQHSDRLSVSLFLEDPPSSEEGILGIKLDVDALDRSGNYTGSGLLDPSGGLLKFLSLLSSLMIDRQFRALNPDGIQGNEQIRLNLAKKSKKEFIQNVVLPKLELDLVTSLSSVIARNFIEQKFFQLRWEPRTDGLIERVYDDTIIHAPSNEIYRTIGVPELRGRVTWLRFREALKRKDGKSSQFVVDAVQNAVASAFAEGPVDNDQVFLTADKRLYRIIITRYNVFFDGGRTMHVYLIPFLSGREPRPAELAMTLLRLTVEFRSDFLDADGPFSAPQFEYYKHDFSNYSNLVSSAKRQLQLSTAASHNIGLDEPKNFEKFLGRAQGATPSEISKMYADWQRELQKILLAGGDSSSSENEFMNEWGSALAEYSTFIETINRNIGLSAVKRVERWFQDGSLD